MTLQKVLVTGGAGHIGSHLADALAARVYTVMKGGRFAPLDLGALEPLGLTLAVGSRISTGSAVDRRSVSTGA